MYIDKYVTLIIVIFFKFTMKKNKSESKLFEMARLRTWGYRLEY